MKRRLREGAKLIVIDPRRIDLVKSPHVEAAHHLALQPGTNVAVLTAMAHVIVTEGLADEAFIHERCDWDEYQDRSEEHTSELQSLMRISYAVFCLKKNKDKQDHKNREDDNTEKATQAE